LGGGDDFGCGNRRRKKGLGRKKKGRGGKERLPPTAMEREEKRRKDWSYLQGGKEEEGGREGESLHLNSSFPYLPGKIQSGERLRNEGKKKEREKGSFTSHLLIMVRQGRREETQNACSF